MDHYSIEELITGFSSMKVELKRGQENIEKTHRVCSSGKSPMSPVNVPDNPMPVRILKTETHALCSDIPKMSVRKTIKGS